MKKKIISLLVLTMVMVLGLSFTGCGSDEESATDVADTTSAEVVEEEVADDDIVTTATEAREAYENKDFSDFNSVDWGEIGKYEVKIIVNEMTESGVYTLVYVSDAKPEDILSYYDVILKDTPNYVLKEIPTIGGIVKGTMNGHGITVSAQTDENAEATSVEFYSYDASYVAE